MPPTSTSGGYQRALRLLPARCRATWDIFPQSLTHQIPDRHGETPLTAGIALPRRLRLRASPWTLPVEVCCLNEMHLEQDAAVPEDQFIDD